MEIPGCAATVIVGMLKIFTIAALHGKVQNFFAVLFSPKKRGLDAINF